MSVEVVVAVEEMAVEVMEVRNDRGNGVWDAE
jgi:hypothetical protein